MTSASCGGVHVWVKLTAEVDGIVYLWDLNTQVYGEVLPIHRVCNEVVSTADA